MSEIGGYGPVVFSVSYEHVLTFERLAEKRRARFATHDVLANEQRLQFLGLDLPEVVLEMSFHQSFCIPQDEANALRALLSKKEAQAYPLVIGGFNFGEMVLEELDIDWETTSNKGQPLVIKAHAKLRKYQ